MIMSSVVIEACRLCNESALEPVLDLGYHPPSDAFLKASELNQEQVYYPLRLVTCRHCGHLQIDCHVDSRILYQRDYPYEQSTTETGKRHYHAMAAQLVDRFQIPADTLAIDIGSNVGVLLEGFKLKGLQVLGVDPAKNMADKAVRRGIPTLADFFCYQTAQRVSTAYGVAKIITGTNVFAHLHNLNDAIEGVKVLLDKKGVLVFESPYALDLVQRLEYDTIYHEHLGYMSAKPVRKLFAAHGLELFDVERTEIHGGSLRYFAGHTGAHVVSSRVEQAIKEEEVFGLYHREVLLEFAQRVKAHRFALTDLLIGLKKQGKRIVGVSAPAKGNTLLNYCHIDTSLLDYITEKAQIKVGLFTPGTCIPIVDDARLLEDQPDYALILAWNFAPEIMKNLRAYKEKGGKFIVPIPEPVVI